MTEVHGYGGNWSCPEGTTKKEQVAIGCCVGTITGAIIALMIYCEHRAGRPVFSLKDARARRITLMNVSCMAVVAISPLLIWRCWAPTATLTYRYPGSS